MVMVLEQQMVEGIAAIGRERAPTEACGLLLPMAVNGVQIIELPNRSKKPRDSFEMSGQDMILALEQVFRGDFPEELVPGLTAWHTHPAGHVGPSRFDLKNKPARINSLVVTLFDNGKPPLATWF
jgi:proteasome lid subunit RPN8/RPN11